MKNKVDNKKLKEALVKRKEDQEARERKMWNDNSTVTRKELEERLQKFENDLLAQLKSVLR